MSEILSFNSTSLDDTQEAGQKIAANIALPSCIYMHADMGQGKTTLTKSIIAAMGAKQTVTSPTYNLIQEYDVDGGTVYHMDLYRLDDPSELEFLALPDLWSPDSLFIIEWPQKGGAYLQKPTHEISIETDAGIRRIIYKTAGP